jgi:uncharacterized membrane protein YhhN
MTTPLIIFGIILSAICAGFIALFLKAFYDKPFVKSLVFKGIASACFVILGAITCFTGEISITKLLIFIGLCFGLVGDEVIHLCQGFPERDSLAFIGGGLFFLVGHLLYIPALLLLGGVNWISVLIAFAVLVSLRLVYAGRRRFLSGEMKIPLALYLGIVSFMACVAIGAFTERLTVGTGLFAVGGVLFALSDNILFAYKMGEKPRFVQNVLLHAAYYIAQILIAWSLACL